MMTPSLSRLGALAVGGIAAATLPFWVGDFYQLHLAALIGVERAHTDCINVGFHIGLHEQGPQTCWRVGFPRCPFDLLVNGVVYAIGGLFLNGSAYASNAGERHSGHVAGLQELLLGLDEQR